MLLQVLHSLYEHSNWREIHGLLAGKALGHLAAQLAAPCRRSRELDNSLRSLYEHTTSRRMTCAGRSELLL